MAISALPVPEFGKADLSNCEREQIQFAASIQPHGALIYVSENGGIILQASANAREFIGIDHDLIGCPIECLGDDLAKHLRPILGMTTQKIPLAARCRLGRANTEFYAFVHTPPEGGFIVELEKAGPTVNVTQSIGKSIQSIVNASSLRILCEETASIFKDLTGYDRVMVYIFDEEGHGEVYSERKEPELEAYLGNRYPASDIPQIARRLYERTRVRVLVDVAYKPVPLEPRLCPSTGRDLDMSLCFLRSMSPIHIQYLKNMGVAATLVVSLVVGGKLWGLVACHHYVPRHIPFETRAACELLAETMATRIAALESFAQAHAELSVRRLDQRMIEAIANDGDWRVALFDNPQALLQPVGASGAALFFEGQILTAGEVPGTLQLREIAEWLSKKQQQPVMHTSSLSLDDEQFTPIVSVASGLIATPISNSPREYLIWFRPERVRMVTWGGPPNEPVIIGDDPSELSPRRSFAKWNQLVERKSEPWSPADLTAAKLIGETVADVVLQFRSLRMLIVKDQLKNVTHQVQISDLPVIIADPSGRILLNNQAFEQLAHETHGHLEWLEDLAPLFTDSKTARRHLRDLVNIRRAWRGEMTMQKNLGENHTVLVRGDPVFASPDRVLGFVLLFTEIADLKAAEVVGQRFQEDIIERHRSPNIGRDAEAGLDYQKLFSYVVDNAQLAALEITDSVDKTRMLQMLESVRQSVNRTADLLDELICHETNSGKKKH